MCDKELDVAHDSKAKAATFNEFKRGNYMQNKRVHTEGKCCDGFKNAQCYAGPRASLTGPFRV